MFRKTDLRRLEIMSNSAIKPKLKPFETGTAGNKGVRFMNKTRPNQKNIISRSTVAPQSLLPQKNTIQKNEGWKGNSTTAISTTKGSIATGSVLSQSMYPAVRTFNAEINTMNKFGSKSFLNVPEEELRGGAKKGFPSISERTAMFDIAKRGIRNNPIQKSANEPNQHDKRSARKTCFEDFGDRQGDNKNVSNKRPLQNSTMETTSHVPKNVKYSSNMNNMYKGSTAPNTEQETNKSNTIKNAEIFLNTYCSPIKRKFDATDNHSSNKNDGGITFEDLRTPNKRFAFRNPNADNANMEYSKNGNVSNEKYYNDINTKKGTNFGNSAGGNSENKEFKNNKVVNYMNESSNSYSKFTNENTVYGINSNIAINGSSNFSEKKLIESRSRNESAINSPYPHGSALKNNDDVNAGAPTRNYTNYERLRNNGNVDLLNIHNAEIANTSHYAEKSKNKNQAEFKESFNSRNADSNIFNSLNNSLIKPGHRNFNYLTDTHSEKMMASSFRVYNNNNQVSAAAMDNMSDENLRSYMNRKVEFGGNGSILNNIHSNVDTESNLMKSSIEKNVSKMNSNASKTKNFMSTDMSNEKLSLMNSILETSNANVDSISLKPIRVTSQPFSEGSLINSNKDTMQDKAARFKQKEGAGNTTPSKVSIEDLKELVKNRKRINFETYEYNDKDISYFKNVISNFSQCSCTDQDVDFLYKNVMTLNDYALNFEFENDRIDKFHNLSNAIKNKGEEAIAIVENDLKRLDSTLQAQNKEYERLCLKLQESEAMFCELNDETGEKKLKVCSQIDEKKNLLRREYLKKKMALDKNKYKLERMKETNQLERRGSIYTGNSFKRRYKLLESIFRIKVLKYDGNMLDLLLMPPNVQKHMWQRIQIERKAVTAAFRKYLWSYVESFSELKRWREYFKEN